MFFFKLDKADNAMRYKKYLKLIYAFYTYVYVHDHKVIFIPKLCGYQDWKFRGFCGFPQFYSGICLSQYLKLGLIHFLHEILID